ncbi:MAG TPA: signal peptide peptidase SppA [Candidatus Binatia bacterium]|nr:signal peptide peptidase SppA [Candidatus Binatia bacterium]
MTDPNEQRRPGLLLRLLRGFYRTGRFFFASIGLFVTIVPLILVSMMLSDDRADELTAQDAKSDVADSVLLQMQLGGVVAETAPDARFALVNRLLGARSHLYLPDLVKVLERASRDERVDGLVVQVEDLMASPAAVAEMRQAFVRFRESGKPLAFHLSEADTEDYYLATAGSSIEMTPTGTLEVPGPVFQLMYMSSALDKLGIEFQVVRAGKYKSAFEPLIADGPSPATLEMMRAMEESLRAHLAETIASARNVGADQVRAWMRRGLFTAEEARRAGLVDKLSYPADHETRMRTEWNASEKLRLSRYGTATKSDDPASGPGAPDEKIAVIEAEGEIVLYDDDADEGGTITPRRLAKAFRWAREQDDVKAVVFRISSPGGSAIASDLIWKEVRRTDKKKPVVVSMGESAASGGYYVAAAASRIIAEPTTITGSIGVLAGLPKLSGFSEKWRLNFHTVTQTDRAGLYSVAQETTREDEELLASHVDETYATFVRKVAKGRGMKMARAYALAEGRVYTGAEAHALGLVDELGGYTEAIKAAVVLAELDTTKTYPTERYGYERNLLDCLQSFSNLEDCISDDETSLALDVDTKLAAQVHSLARAFHRERVLLRLPFLLAGP